MKPIKIVKISVDILMYVLFLLLMGQHLASGTLHEWLGVGLFVCFLAHNILNYRWYKALFKGKYPPQRIIQTAINFLLMLSFIGCMLSALMISGVVFQDMRIPGMMMFGRKLHMASTAWCFVFMSMHLGMHIRTPKKKRQRLAFMPYWVQRPLTVFTTLSSAISMKNCSCLPNSNGLITISI